MILLHDHLNNLFIYYYYTNMIVLIIVSKTICDENKDSLQVLQIDSVNLFLLFFYFLFFYL